MQVRVISPFVLSSLGTVKRHEIGEVLEGWAARRALAKGVAVPVIQEIEENESESDEVLGLQDFQGGPDSDASDGDRAGGLRGAESRGNAGGLSDHGPESEEKEG